jgi:excisionase family DNA binding protein
MDTTTQLVFRIHDLARALGCSELAARRMVERGEVPARRWGRRIVILADELREHLRRLPAHASGEEHETVP